jgi:hypothetical protein
MRRLLLVLFAGLLLNMHLFAQWDDYDNDYDGYDDYDDSESEYYEDEQPAATADPGAAGSAPTNITVRNSGVEDQSEQKLTLPNSQPIYLYFYNNVQNPAAPEPAAAPPTVAAPAETKSTQPAETRIAAPPPEPPPPVIEYRYLPQPAPEPVFVQPPVEYRYIPMPPQVEYIYVQPQMPEPVYVPPAPVYVPPAPFQIRIVPGLPSPDSPRIYRLQVGSYAVHNTADMMVQRLRSAGLQAGIEYYNSLKRVFVPGVRAVDAASVVQILELLGFEEVWIRE